MLDIEKKLFCYRKFYYLTGVAHTFGNLTKSETHYLIVVKAYSFLCSYK